MGELLVIRLRMNQPIAPNTTAPINSAIMILPSAAPMPKLLASQARPRPAASPPNIAPHGAFGAGAGAGATTGGVCCAGGAACF